MKLTKVAFAIASVLAVAAGSANAGQIDSSSATLAIEVIKSDAQVVRAPSKTYNFAGDIDARTNEQRLQLQYTLAKGTWAVGGTNLITAADTLVDVSTAGTVLAAYTDASVPPVAQTSFPTGTSINAFVTNSGKTLVFNITVPAGANNLLRAPSVTINPGALAAGNVGVTGLFSVAGAAACVAPDQNLDINFKHFTNHTGSATLQTVASPDSEHVRSGSTNDARLLNFTQNLDFQFTPATSTSRTSAASLNTTLAAPANYNTTTFAGLPFTNQQHYLGKVNARQKSNGLDLDYVHTYGDSVAPFVAASPFIAGDFVVIASPAGATLDTGVVELASATVKVALPTAWPVGTVLTARTATGAAIAGIADVTTTAGQTSVTLTATSALAAAELANGAHLFAIFPGTSLIPQSGGLAVTASLVKAPSVADPDKSEQNNVCSDTLTGIGGGIKIDVRNYASYASNGDTGARTTIRLINNSETQSADVYAQIIYADGTYGAWGKLADLKPREVQNLPNYVIEAALTTAPAANNPFGTAANLYATKGGSVVVAGPKSSSTSGNYATSDRLRIVSNTGSTLRVQSYMVVGNSVIDTSNAQGVDFENSRDAVPVTARDSQPISQDAVNGLGK